MLWFQCHIGSTDQCGTVLVSTSGVICEFAASVSASCSPSCSKAVWMWESRCAEAVLVCLAWVRMALDSCTHKRQKKNNYTLTFNYTSAIGKYTLWPQLVLFLLLPSWYFVIRWSFLLQVSASPRGGRLFSRWQPESSPPGAFFSSTHSVSEPAGGAIRSPYLKNSSYYTSSHILPRTWEYSTEILGKKKKAQFVTFFSFCKHSAHVGQSIVAMTHLIQPDISAAVVWDRHRMLRRKEMTVAHVLALCAAALPPIPRPSLPPPMTERWPLPHEFELVACGRNTGNQIWQVQQTDG